MTTYTEENVIGNYASRDSARRKAGRTHRVVRRGWFANGSFGCYAPLDSHGRTIGGPNTPVCVWAVVRK